MEVYNSCHKLCAPLVQPEGARIAGYYMQTPVACGTKQQHSSIPTKLIHAGSYLVAQVT